jgi:hypothetical protein
VAWSFLWLVPLIGLRLKNAGMHVGVIVGLLVGSVWLGVVVILCTQSVLSLNFSGTPTFSLTWAGYLLSFIIFLVLPTGFLKAGVSAWKIMFGVVGSAVISTMFFAATLQGVIYARDAVGGSETSDRTANLLTQKLNRAVDGNYQLWADTFKVDMRKYYTLHDSYLAFDTCGDGLDKDALGLFAADPEDPTRPDGSRLFSYPFDGYSFLVVSAEQDTVFKVNKDDTLTKVSGHLSTSDTQKVKKWYKRFAAEIKKMSVDVPEPNQLSRSVGWLLTP